MMGGLRVVADPMDCMVASMLELDVAACIQPREQTVDSVAVFSSFSVAQALSTWTSTKPTAMDIMKRNQKGVAVAEAVVAIVTGH
jgi:hypothetical protein